MSISIILAAGEGTRMKSGISKTLHRVCGKEMIKYVIEAAENSGTDKNIVVLGHGKESVEHAIEGMNVETVEQPVGPGVPYGTGFAVMAASDFINDDDSVIILCGDSPLIREETLSKFMKYHEDNGCAVSVMTAYLDNPGGYGRIVRSHGTSMGIVEEKDASEEVKKIKEVNTGIYCFNGKLLKYSLGKIGTDNSQCEYYLTDTIKVLNSENYKTGCWVLEDSTEMNAVNDRAQLAEVTKMMQERINRRHMLSGVTLINPENTYIDASVAIGMDTVIYPGTILEGKTAIGSNCTIGPNAYIIDSTIHDNALIESSKVIESVVGNGTKVGPFAYLRPGTNLGKNVKIGDFVEVKKSTIGDNSKSSHLAYIGDAEIGKNVNIGCGVIFVNYDGKNKHLTTVGDGAFIGSNSNLIAPVNISQKSFVACGSTITDDVEEGDLAIARARQVNKKGLGKNRY